MVAAMTAPRQVFSAHLVGTAEIMGMLGVGRARATTIATSKGFPDHVQEIAAGRMWDGKEVAAWAQANGRTIQGPWAGWDGTAEWVPPGR